MPVALFTLEHPAKVGYAVGAGIREIHQVDGFMIVALNVAQRKLRDLSMTSVVDSIVGRPAIRPDDLAGGAATWMAVLDPEQ